MHNKSDNNSIIKKHFSIHNKIGNQNIIEKNNRYLESLKMIKRIFFFSKKLLLHENSN